MGVLSGIIGFLSGVRVRESLKIFNYFLLNPAHGVFVDVYPWF